MPKRHVDIACCLFSISSRALKDQNQSELNLHLSPLSCVVGLGNPVDDKLCNFDPRRGYLERQAPQNREPMPMGQKTASDTR